MIRMYEMHKLQYKCTCRKLKIILPCDPAIPFDGIQTKNPFYSRDHCTSLFLASLPSTAKKWKQPKCASLDVWRMKTWYIETEILLILKKWKS